MRRHLSFRLLTTSVALLLSTIAQAQGLLDTAVALAGADGNALSAQVPPGPLTFDLYFYSTGALKEPAARLAVTNLQTKDASPGTVVTTVQVLDASGSGRDGVPVNVTLSTSEPLRVRISADRLRAGATYTARVLLSNLEDTRDWALTLTTGARAALVVDPMPALQFERPLLSWPCSLVGWLLPCNPAIGEFTLGVRPKAPTYAIDNLGVRLVPANTNASDDIQSNFTIDNFRFSTAKAPLPPDAPSAGAAPTAGATPGADTRDMKPRWYKATVLGLMPGAYSGLLAFDSAGETEETNDSRAAVAINVRDPWLYPVLVLVIGSGIGWFTAKYLVASRKARDMSRAIGVLRERADSLARGEVSRQGWEFANEATSYALIKVRVILNRVARLTTSGLPMLVQETEMTQSRDDADARLTKIEALRELRLRVQREIDKRPTAQRVVGGLLRRATQLLEHPTFGATQQASFMERLQEVQPWTVAATRLEKYREALLGRLDENATINLADISAPLRPHVEAILKAWPTAAAINDATATMATLQPIDESFEKAAFLVREQGAAWAPALAAGCQQGMSLRALFDLADLEFWKTLETLADKIQMTREAAREASVDTFDPIELHLTIPGIDRGRVLKHPLRVVWTITSPDGHVRLVETENTTLVQYFASPGNATVTAQLQWESRVIPVPAASSLDVKSSRDYAWYQLFVQGGGVELIAVLIAILFAVVAAMQTQYDSTFGSSSEYLGLFLWAAGAAAGGNFLKQLGTTSTPGGQADNALPSG